VDTSNQPKVALAAAILAEDQSEHIARAEAVRGTPRGPAAGAPIRLSAPLLEALDRIAAREGRKRGNLVQHALWDYVHGRSTETRRAPGA
jgi:hypothetical protein